MPSNCKYAGGATYKDGHIYHDEIFTYSSALDSWDITGRMREPRAWHVVAPIADVSVVCPSTNTTNTTITVIPTSSSCRQCVKILETKLMFLQIRPHR